MKLKGKLLISIILIFIWNHCLSSKKNYHFNPLNLQNGSKTVNQEEWYQIFEISFKRKPLFIADEFWYKFDRKSSSQNYLLFSSYLFCFVYSFIFVKSISLPKRKSKEYKKSFISKKWKMKIFRKMKIFWKSNECTSMSLCLSKVPFITRVAQQIIYESLLVIFGKS